MVKNNNIIRAFSIVEALVSSSILVIVLIFALRSTTTKHKEPDPPYRGIYRCECNNGVLRNYYITNGSINDDNTINLSENPNGSCVFYPQEGVNLYTVKVWNVYSSHYNSKDRAQDYVLTSFSKRSANITLGDGNSPDISIEDVLNVSDIVPEETCLIDADIESDCNDLGGAWNEDRRMCTIGLSKQDCLDSSFVWRGESEFCSDGTNLEISW